MHLYSVLLSHWYLVEFRNKAYATINGYFDTRFIREHAKSEGNYNKPEREIQQPVLPDHLSVTISVCNFFYLLPSSMCMCHLCQYLYISSTQDIMNTGHKDVLFLEQRFMSSKCNHRKKSCSVANPEFVLGMPILYQVQDRLSDNATKG